MRIRSALLGIAVILLAASAFAHGGKVHVRGTITSVSDTAITIKGPDGKPVVVKLVKSTIYMLHQPAADQPAKASDLIVGANVVVHATREEDDSLDADEIKFSAPTKSTPSK